MPTDAILSRAIADTATPLTGSWSDFDLLLEWIGDAPFVLLGEATHGMHELYRIRAELTKRLIREKGFGLLHLDETRALEPLERTAAWERGELPETYPTGL
jgi:erythromycin esterase-like protein